MNEIGQLDAGHLISALNRCVLTVETTLRCFDEMEDLNFSRQMETLVETAHQFEVSDEKWAGMVDQARAEIKKELQGNRAITLNWGLVTLWSTFEALLEDLLLFWFQEDSRAFLSWGGTLSLTFEEIKDVGDADTIKTKYFEKAIRTFTSGTIAERIKTLEKKLGVRGEILFSQRLANAVMKARLGDWSPSTLSEISDKRNRIVHRLAVPLSTIEELQRYEVILERFLLNIASIIGGKLKMPVMAYGVEVPSLT